VHGVTRHSRAAERVPLGRTSLAVTRLGLGAAPLGGLYAAVGDDLAAATVERAWRLGLRWFDTAPLYGGGLSERRLGSVLRAKPRAEYVLATKVGRLLVPADTDGQEIWGESTALAPVFDYSYAATRHSLTESLERLGLERVDVLHIHDPDQHYQQALDGAYRALADLRSAGVIGAVGAGMNQSAMLADFARAADFDCFLLAGRYTLLDQSGLADLLPLCAERGIAVIAGGVLNSGLLADPVPGARFDYRPAPPSQLAKAIAMREVCDRYGIPLAAAALQFPLGHPAVATVLVGARSPHEIAEDVALFDLEIPGALWADLKRTGLLPQEVPTPEPVG
jgi:aryl-alcohol dehydrogenase-like predicted oxidoreductase